MEAWMFGGAIEEDEEEQQIWLENQIDEEDHDAQMQNILASWISGTSEETGSTSREGKSPNIDRERRARNERIHRDYFAQHPVYTPEQFRRRFRMQRSLFLKILERVVAHDDYFLQKPDATGLTGLSAIQKMTAALRMLAYGIVADALDEYIRIGESTSLACLRRFCLAVVEIYSAQYLRVPTAEDTQRILAFNQARGFPGMIGCIDCMHWGWKNCPRAWAGQFQDKSKKPTIVLEAIASYDLWIWHAFFGMPGSNNDINVLDRSNVFKDQVDGVAPKTNFHVNGHLHIQTYLLSDGIYPQWPTFVKPIAEPQGEKRKHFAKMQEAARKDIERAFGVLQARWHIIRQPGRSWSKNTLKLIMTACLILHNLIVEDEHSQDMLDLELMDFEGLEVMRGGQVRDTRLPTVITNNRLLMDAQKHNLLMADLVEHLWAKKGEM